MKLAAPSSLRVLAAAFGFVFTAGLLHAQPTTLLADNFSDLERATQSPPGSAAWTVSRPAATLSAAAGELAWTLGTNNNGFSLLAHFTGEGAARVLNVGDQIVLEFRFSTGSEPANAFRGLRFGLLDSGGSRLAADNHDNSNAAFSGWRGYLCTANLGSTGGNNREHTERTGAGATLFSSSLYTQVGAGAAGLDLAASTPYVAKLKIRRISATDVELTSTLAGSVQTTLDIATNVTAFDTVAIFFGNNVAASATIDDVVVTYFAYSPAPPIAPVGARYPEDSGVVNVQAFPYGAKGDGVTDDTAALQLALTENPGGRLYLPNGTYLISDSLLWPSNGSSGAYAVVLQGQTQTGAIIKLANNAAGFGDPLTPKRVLHTDRVPTGDANRFGCSVMNLTVDSGIGNPGAVGLQYFSNNYGEVSDVTIRSGDGQGAIGLDLSAFNANGPFLLRNVTVDGFSYGIKAAFLYESHVMEHITLRNQTVCGIYNADHVISIRGLTSTGLNVPALHNASGHVVLLDASLAGGPGSSGVAAVVNVTGKMLVRNLLVSGYGTAISDPVDPVTGPYCAEWRSDPTVTLFASPDTTLNLPIQETPPIIWDDPATWANIRTFGAREDAAFDSAPAFQAAIDSGATTVYIPQGRYELKSPIVVRGNVRRIIGTAALNSKLAHHDTAIVGGNGVFTFDPVGAPVVTFERISLANVTDRLFLYNSTARTAVMRDCQVTSVKFTGSGETYLEGVSMHNTPAGKFEFGGTGRVWARQLNPETNGTKLFNTGARVWILGLKSERAGTLVDNSGGGVVELLGGMAFSLNNASGSTLVRNVEGDVSVSLNELLGRHNWGSQPFGTLVNETRGGTAMILPRGEPPSFPANASIWNEPTHPAYNPNLAPKVGSDLVLFNGYTVSASSFTSVAAEDGFVYEAVPGSGIGSVRNAAGDVIVGDLDNNGQYRAIVSFDTSSLPDDATVLGATLRLKRKSITGADPFLTFGPCFIDVKGGNGFSNNPTLNTADFHNPADAASIGVLPRASADGAIVEVSLAPAALRAVNRAGRTQLRLRLQLANNGNGASDTVRFHPGEAGAGNQPELIVTYK
jgi:hypothetical protein